MSAASTELATIARRLDPDHPIRQAGGRLGSGSSERGWVATSVTARRRGRQRNPPLGMTIVALVALVLVVACTNLRTSCSARGTARQGELAIRMAMGASRGRLIWEQCVERT